jgi:hypothetical protein
MSRSVQLAWIAEAEARHFTMFASTQRAISEPGICVVPGMASDLGHHWWRALMAVVGPRAAEGGGRSGCSRLRLVHPSSRRR